MAPSPFLDPGPVAATQSLALIHLRRDQLIPTLLADDTSEYEYAEGHVTNTRFGSFPHSTLINQPWGTQILASVVNTGLRNQKRGDKGNKRKRDADDSAAATELEDGAADGIRTPTVAASGFAHLLPPTPEQWTISLPHRTQVVYTPDYSYILQRLQVRPGSCIIEAGAGSGSFTHASARAVFNGYPGTDDATRKRPKRMGKVYSFEYHEPRAIKLQSEVKEHGLDSIVQVTHRDVYQDGFCIDNSPEGNGPSEPRADAIFLDLPAPCVDLYIRIYNLYPHQHFSTSRSIHHTSNLIASLPIPTQSRTTTRICTFSPCIEQVDRTANCLRELGWLEIDMVEVQHKRIDVRRERNGPSANSGEEVSSVEEAVTRLKQIEATSKEYHAINRSSAGEEGGGAVADAQQLSKRPKAQQKQKQGRGQQQQQQQQQAKAKLGFKEGRIVHKTETELKTHTSYLLFAVLPRVWTKADDERCNKKWKVAEGEEGKAGEK